MTAAFPSPPAGATGHPRHDLIVFDWDGTLYDSTVHIARCIQAACADVGAPVPSDLQASYVIGLGLGEALAHVAPDLPRERHADLAARYRHHYQSRREELDLFDGARELLQDLKQDNRLLAIATGKTRRGLDDVLAHSGLDRLFDATRTADETASKPNPRMLVELMGELGVAPARTVMIGDTTHDLLMARAAGTAALGVSYGAHPHFGDVRPDAVVGSIGELRDWLLRGG